MNRGPRPGVAAAALLLFAILLRCWDFGSPIIHVDEQYYLLVGERMLDGAIPYLDIWDRKPVGLFLLYALFASVPGDPIWSYQIAAMLFAAATGWIVSRIARDAGAGPLAALVGGVAYILWLSLLGGRGGQSPVFYNLPVAAAACLTLRLPRRGTARAVIGSGIAACLLAGVAIQMKYSAALEGAFFGLAHLWRLRQIGARWVGATMLLLAAGLAPTLLVAGWYWLHGGHAFQAFWFANFVSILHRPGYPLDQLASRLAGVLLILSPLIGAALVAARRRAVPPLLAGWLVAAVIGFAAIGTFFDHYALPLATPLAVAAALGFALSLRLAAVVLAAGALIFGVTRARIPDDDAGVRQVAQLIRANSQGQCPYVFIGDTILYHLATVCPPTRYAFPNFLAYTTERGATGIDEAAEVARIMATRPPVVVTSTRRLDIWNPDSLAALRPALARDYRLIASVPRAGYRTQVYLRR